MKRCGWQPRLVRPRDGPKFIRSVIPWGRSSGQSRIVAKKIACEELSSPAEKRETFPSSLCNKSLQYVYQIGLRAALSVTSEYRQVIALHLSEGEVVAMSFSHWFSRLYLTVIAFPLCSPPTQSATTIDLNDISCHMR